MPAGPPSSPILLVAEFPGGEEMKQGRPFVGQTGDILTEELGRVGLQLSQFRITTLWLHQIAKKGEPCPIDFHLQQLVGEMIGRKVIFLMGSDTVKRLCKQNMTDVSSLRVVGPFIPSDAIALASPNPAIAMHGSIGELRLAFTRLSEVIRYVS
jgi:DNA polymerase